MNSHSMNPHSSIKVIIVNFNACETIVGCVQAVLDSDQKSDVVVHDNASSDGSVDLIQRHFAQNDHVELIQASENIGFSRALNCVANGAKEEFLLFLNPDCEIFPAALGHLKRALEEDPNAALAGPLVVNLQGDVQKGTLRDFPDPWRSFLTLSGLWRLEGRFPSFRGIDRHLTDLPQDNTAVQAVSGACMLVRRKLFVQVGSMDEEYGLHCEDLDLMYRFHLAGKHCLLVPASQVFHQQGVSSRSRPLWVHRQKHLGMQRFFHKFQAAAYPVTLRWLVIAGIWLRYALTLPRVILRN